MTLTKEDILNAKKVKAASKPEVVEAIAKEDNYLYHYSTKEGETYIKFKKGEKVEVPLKFVESVVARNLIDQPKNNKKKEKEND